MKRLIIAAGVSAILIFGAVALVITIPGDATARQTETTEPDVEAPLSGLSEQLGDLFEGLVDRDLITSEQSEDITGRLEDIAGQLEGILEDTPQLEDILEDITKQFADEAPWDMKLPEGFDSDSFDSKDFVPHMLWGRDIPKDLDPDMFGECFPVPKGFGFFGDEETATDLFGMTPEELAGAMADGTPLTDLIEDPEALIDSIVEQMSEGLSEAVESGLMTQDEADELIAQARAHAEALITGEEFDFGGFGFMNGRGFGGGFGPFGDGFGPFHDDFWNDPDADPSAENAVFFI